MKKSPPYDLLFIILIVIALSFAFYSYISNSNSTTSNKPTIEDHKLISKSSENNSMSSATSDVWCENIDDMQKFEKPIPVIWTAQVNGCLSSCQGASFTRVPKDETYPRFSAYYPDNKRIPEEFLRDGLKLKIYGKWTDIDASYVNTVFENRCVPTVEIERIEIIK